MKHWQICAALAATAIVSTVSPCSAQNVSGYDTIENPYLLLLREPAVHEELQLSGLQQTALQKLNDRIDGPLLALRNLPVQEANKIFTGLVQPTRDEIDTLLDREQRERLSQIMLRVRGIKLVLTPQVVQHLNLSPAQRETIERILKDAAEEIVELQKKLQAGQPRDQVEAAARLAREREQRAVLSELTEEQKRTLDALLGPSFDPSRLGRAKFKAPELVESGAWINSRELRIADLRGQVIAVHFWAFG